MKPGIIAAFSFACGFGGLPTAVIAQTDSAPHAAAEVRTAASAERRVKPDVATLTFSFNASGTTPLGAGRAVAARVDSLRTALALAHRIASISPVQFHLGDVTAARGS